LNVASVNERDVDMWKKTYEKRPRCTKRDLNIGKESLNVASVNRRGDMWKKTNEKRPRYMKRDLNP